MVVVLILRFVGVRMSLKLNKHIKYDLADLQKQMVKDGELVTPEVTATFSENALGNVLIDAGIPVVPQFVFAGRSFDFKVVDHPILIEVDGGIHGELKKRQADYVKDRFVLRRGFRVIRFSNHEATHNPENLVNEVRATIRHLGRCPKLVRFHHLSLLEQFVWWWDEFKGRDPKKRYN